MANALRDLCILAVALLAGSCVPEPRSFTTAAALPGAELRVAILPLANYTAQHDAPAHVAPLLVAEVGVKPGVRVADAGAVEAALAREPWLLLDRVPPDLVQRLADSLAVDALLVGSLQAFDWRDTAGERVPQVSISLRLVSASSGSTLWSAVHSRDGDDAEWLFGFGRVRSLEQLAAQTVREMLRTFPAPRPAESRTAVSQSGRNLP
jgi:hypothetical protein